MSPLSSLVNMTELEDLNAQVTALRDELALHDRWIAAHDGKSNELWRQQHKLNDEIRDSIKDVMMSMTEKLNAVFKRIGGLERKLAWFSGLAAAAGGLVGGFLT